MSAKKLVLLIALLLVIIGGFLTFNLYTKIYAPNTSKEGYIYIPTNSSMEQVEDSLRPFLKRVKPFVWVAGLKNYSNTIKPGKYFISKDLSNNDLVNLLRSGNQTIVKLSFNNQDNLKKLAGRIAEQIEADSIDLLASMSDKSFINISGFSKHTAIGMYVPNTYDFYWNTSADAFRERMYKEYNNFWNANRLEQSKKQQLSKNEVIILASIVQKETALVEERPIVAQLYLNRLYHNWPLQADPTIIFALKQASKNDVVIKRVLTKDLSIDSPYNTYINLGLPPGPIAMPDISSIDAVLNPSKHKYYYMCASSTRLGSHEFSETLSQHNKNAKKYQTWLSKQGINR
jgi:UPF0755 protein